ncbi:MAG: two-component system, OmpR family, response regulator [Desulfovibrionales bacterium]|nr:two-component system, OmpR family, response regulator [Desulfovibrionales bacterium]
MAAGRIIIVEDDVEQLETLVEFLELKGFDVHGAQCALDLFQALVGGAYDVAIVDIGLPDKSGFKVVEHLRQNTSMGIIVLTARDSMDDKLRGYELGADHYFVKPLDSRELAAAAGSLIERMACSSASIDAASGVEWRLAPSRWMLASPAGQDVKLTEKEVAFLHLLLSHGNEVVSRDTILQALDYRAEESYGGRALAVMVTRLRKKIRDQAGVELPIKTIRSHGYSFSAPAAIV